MTRVEILLIEDEVQAMNVIMTGATGFIGSNLLRTLLHKGHKVTVIVRDSTKIDSEIKSKINIINCDLEDINSLIIAPLPQHNDTVFFHFSWEGTSGSSRGDTEKQLNNIKYACEALRLAVRSGCKKFINAGSIMEYEVMKNLTVDGFKPEINNIYAVSKLTADFILKTLAATLNIEYNNVIISNVYGPGEKSERFLCNTLKKMLDNKPIEMTEGLQLYDFIYIDDAVEAIVAVASNGLPFHSYYIGNKQQKPLRNYMQEMKRVLNSKSELRFGAIPFNRVGLNYTEFNTNSLETIGIVPKIDFSEGIMITRNWILKGE